MIAAYLIGGGVVWYIICCFAVDYVFRYGDKRAFIYGGAAAVAPIGLLILCGVLGIRL